MPRRRDNPVGMFTRYQSTLLLRRNRQSCFLDVHQAKRFFIGSTVLYMKQHGIAKVSQRTATFLPVCGIEELHCRVVIR